MKPLTHFSFSLILAVMLFPIYKWKSIFILAGGVLIDIDHYFWYVFKYKKFSILESYKFYVRNVVVNDFSNVMGILLVFHTIEFLILMIILSFFSQIALITTIGLLLHYLMDALFLLFVAKKVIANHSIILWIIKNRTK